MGNKANDSGQLKFRYTGDKGIVFDIPGSNHYRCVVDWRQIWWLCAVILMWIV
jgi:hypothetical protein